MEYPTIFELASRLLLPEEGKKAHKASASATDGITPKRITLEPDKIYWLGPAELAHFYLEISPTGIRGAQRDPTVDAAGRRQVRELADAIRAGKVLPDVPVALSADGEIQEQFIPDGGNRACASFLARLPIRCATRLMTPEQRKQMFLDQSKARKLGTQKFVVDGDEPVALYVQDALTSEAHPWATLVAEKAGRGRMSALQMAALAGAYGCDQIRGSYLQLDQSRFDRNAANDLAELLRCFGSYELNPVAFLAKSRRATTLAAIRAVRRSNKRPEDIARWRRHMPEFRFADAQHVREATALADLLIAHWNKRLSPDRKVQR